jgi:hypothetical protein
MRIVEWLKKPLSGKDALQMKAAARGMVIHGRKDRFVLPGGRGVDKPHKVDRVGL